MKKIIAVIICFAAFIASSQTPPLPIGYIPLADSATVLRDSPKSLRPKPKGAGASAKAAQKQVGFVTAARPAAAAASLAVVVLPPKMMKLIWVDAINPPSTSYNIYHSFSLTAPMVLITNTAVKYYDFVADKPQEFFRVRALLNGIESN